MLDNTAPWMEHELSTTAWTNKPVTATILGFDDASGFDYFEVLETGELFQGNVMEYVFHQNGSITIRGYDVAGNYADMVVEVGNIDLTAPVLTVRTNKDERENDFDLVMLTITAEDPDEGLGVSGIAGIYLPDGRFVESDTVIISVDSNGSFSFGAGDRAGNMAVVETIIIDFIEEEPNDCEHCGEDCDKDCDCGCANGEDCTCGGDSGNTGGGKPGGPGSGNGNGGSNGRDKNNNFVIHYPDGLEELEANECSENCQCGCGGFGECECVHDDADTDNSTGTYENVNDNPPMGAVVLGREVWCENKKLVVKRGA